MDPEPPEVVVGDLVVVVIAVPPEVAVVVGDRVVIFSMVVDAEPPEELVEDD